MKYGIKRGYPHIRKYLGRTADYLGLIRPLTLFSPVIIGIFGSLMVHTFEGGDLASFKLMYPLVVAIAAVFLLAQASGQVFNQAMEKDLDAINKPYRPIPQGRISIKGAAVFSFLLAGMSLMISYFMSPYFMLLIAIMVGLSITYTVYVKRKLGFNLLWMGLGRGFLPVIALWLLIAGKITVECLSLATLAFLWMFAFQSTKDFGDVKGDAKFSVRTLPVVYGERGAIRIMVGMASLFIAVGIILPLAGFLPLSYAWLILGLSILVPIILTTLRKTTATFENNVAWIGMYVGLAMLYIVSAIINLTCL